PVDNHTTSMGMMEIMGSRTGRFTRNDSVPPLVLRRAGMVHFFWRTANKNLPETGLQRERGVERIRKRCHLLKESRAPWPGAELLARRCLAPLQQGAQRCRMRRPPRRLSSHAARGAWF